MNKFCDAFISYGRPDSLAFGRKLHVRLLEEELKVWFDQHDIPLGVDFQNQIDDGIEKAHNFLFIIAPHSVNSSYCLKEIELALKCNKRIIPLLHVEQISEETWQQRNPHGTPQDWEAYKAQGKHTVFQNMHPTIGKINWVYFREGIDDFEKSFAGLIELFKRHADYVEQHARFLAKALEWERHQKQTSYLLVGEERQQAEAWLKIRFKDEQSPCVPSDLHCEYITESIKNANNLMTQVFISYADADRVTMEKIRSSLRRESITVWTNTTDIQTGEAFEKAIKRGIEQADNVVYLLSPDSVKSDFARQELEYALSLNKQIIPVLVRKTAPEQIPKALGELQYIDLTDNVKEDDYLLDESQLLKNLHEDAAYYNEHKVLLTKALKWKRQHENPSILLRGYNLRSAETWLKVAKTRTQHPPIPLQEEFITESLRQPPAESLDVFVSYSRADADFARKLNDTLQMQGKTTWFDQESIASGSDFQQEIYRGIKVCDNFLFILSPRSVNSPYCADEVEYAASLNKRFVTVLHRKVNPVDVHPELAKVQWIDFNQNDRDFNANFNQLVRTLDTDREHVQSHTKWLQRAIEWDSKDRSADLLLRGNEFAVAENWLQEAEKENKQPAPTDLQKALISESREAIFAGIKQEKHRAVILKSLLALVSAGFLIAVVGSVVAFNQYQKALAGQIESLVASSEARFALGEHFNALLISLRAAKKLQTAGWVANNPQLRTKVVTALQQSISQVRERNRLESHQGSINNQRFSPDSQMLATASDDRTAKLWKLDGTELYTLKGHHGEVKKVRFSPDGKTIATGSDDGNVKLWRTDGTLIITLTGGREGAITDVEFSPDGKTIATGSDDGNVKLWRLDGSLITTLISQKKQEEEAEPSVDADNPDNLASITDLEISPDSKTIAAGSDDGNVKLWQQQPNGTWSLIPTKHIHEFDVLDVEFSPDGKTIATASMDNTVILWDLKGKLLHKLERHTDWVRSVSFSPDSKRIATASDDKTVIVWDRDKGIRQLTLTGHNDYVTHVSFSPDGKTIATASVDKTVKLWRLDGNLIATLIGHNDVVSDVRFSPNGNIIASISKDRTVKLWNSNNQSITTLKRAGSPSGKTSFEPNTIIFSPKGQMFMTTETTDQGEDKNQLWRADGTRLITQVEESKIQDLRFSPDDRTFVTKDEKDSVNLWKVDGTRITPLDGFPLHLDSSPNYSDETDDSSKGFSPDGQTLATTIPHGDSSSVLKLWKADGTRITTLADDGEDLESASFTPYEKEESASLSPYEQTPIISGQDSPVLVTSDKNGPVKVWRSDGEEITTLSEKSGEEGVRLTPSPDRQVFVTTNDKGVKLWNANGTLIKTLQKQSKEFVNIGINSGAATVEFSPDSQTIALVSQKTVKLWNRDGTLIDTLTHNADVIELSFSPDSQMFASASADNKVMLWNRNSRLTTTFTDYSDQITDLHFRSDNKILIAATTKEIGIRHLEGLTDLKTLLKRGCGLVEDYLRTSPNLEKSDSLGDGFASRDLCKGIGTQK